MEEISVEYISGMLENQKRFFASGKTPDIRFRIDNLKKFKSTIVRYEKKITDALWVDLHKSYEEAWLTEISIVLLEIDNHISHLNRWVKSRRVSTPLFNLPSSGKIIYEPLGIALIIAPWNYPFQLLMNPLIGAISAGCCAVLKPSPYTPTVAGVMEEMILETFEPGFVGIVQGGRDTNRILLEKRFDIIFFTGSPSLGKIVMKAASGFLTPVVLELGGKSPCIVDKDARIGVAAKRIAWGKTINAGQTCIAPDYLFVHESVKEELIAKIEEHIEKMYGPNIRESKYFARIVNLKAIERLQGLLFHGKIIYGGEVDPGERFIAPTIIDEVSPDFPVMQQEIFGPILPVMTFSDITEVISYVNAHEKPLAFYYFGGNTGAKNILLKTTSGGGCINDTLMHVANHRLPFGGVGNSGMGKYHGYDSFLSFSNRRAIVTTPTWIDIAMRYAPFNHFNLLKKFF